MSGVIVLLGSEETRRVSLPTLSPSINHCPLFYTVSMVDADAVVYGWKGFPQNRFSISRPKISQHPNGGECEIAVLLLVRTAS